MSLIPKRYQYDSYDVDTGQVYAESIVRAGTLSTYDWTRKPRSTRALKDWKRATQQVPSLLELSMWSVAREIGNLTARHLEVLPESIGQSLWTLLRDRCDRRELEATIYAES